MDEEIETLTVGVRADVAAFQRDIATMQGQLEGPLVSSADKAGRVIEAGLLRAVRSGKLGFEDLGRVALSVMSQIATAALKDGLGALGLSGGGAGGGGVGVGDLARLGASLISSVLGLPGRATGGPVAPGQAYLVGERGPEVFLPTSSGQIVPPGAGASGRDVRLSITVRSDGQDAPRALARSAQQVARAVRGALGD